MEYQKYIGWIVFAFILAMGIKMVVTDNDKTIEPVAVEEPAVPDPTPDVLDPVPDMPEDMRKKCRRWHEEQKWHMFKKHCLEFKDWR